MMAKFNIYNIQLLPNEKDVKEVGARGYKKLFSKLREKNREHLKHRTHEDFHFLSNGRYYGPLEFHFSAGKVSGYFIRYAKADSIIDLSTRKIIYSKTKNTAGARQAALIPFVWDTNRHLLAIDSSLLPKPSIVMEMLEGFFARIAAEDFPDYGLTINLISKRTELETVFMIAKAYGPVRATLYSQNGELEGMLRELQENRIGKLQVDASPSDKGKITGLPLFLKNILRATRTHGLAAITYFVASEQDGGLERRVYDSVAEPASFIVRQGKDDVDGEKFFQRAAEKLAEVDISTIEDSAADTTE